MSDSRQAKSAIGLAIDAFRDAAIQAAKAVGMNVNKGLLLPLLGNVNNSDLTAIRKGSDEGKQKPRVDALATIAAALRQPYPGSYHNSFGKLGPWWDEEGKGKGLRTDLADACDRAAGAIRKQQLTEARNAARQVLGEDKDPSTADARAHVQGGGQRDGDGGTGSGEFAERALDTGTLSSPWLRTATYRAAKRGSGIRLPVVRYATAHDLSIFQMQLARFTSNLVPLEERLAISRKNAGCFRVIEDVRNEEWRRLLDIVAVYPLNDNAMSEVLLGKMRGADVRAKHVNKTFSGAAGLYVSFAEGRTPITKFLVLSELQNAAEKVRRRPFPVATIPTTLAALRITSKRGFEDLEKGPPQIGKICVLNVRDDGGHRGYR